MNFRRLLPALLVALLALPAVHAQAINGSLTCTGTPTASATCTDSISNLIIVPAGTAAGSSITDTSTGAGGTVIDSTIIGAANHMTTGSSPDWIVGVSNNLNSGGVNGTGGSLDFIQGFNNNASPDPNATGPAGGIWFISGYNNTITSNDANILINGSGNTVSGTQGMNWGITVLGGSNNLTASSGSVLGSVNTLSNVLRGSVSGYLNQVTNAQDPAISGNNNTVTGNQQAVVGDGNTLTQNASAAVGNGNTLNGQGNVLGNGNVLGPDATNTTMISNGGTTDRSNVVFFGSRTLAGVAPGVLQDDGVNLGQLSAAVTAFGGGANYLNGVWTGPLYSLTGAVNGNYTDVGTALEALDQAIPTSGGGTGPAGPQGPQGPQGPAGAGGNVTAGKNITVTQNGSTFTVSTTNTPTFTKVTATNGTSTTTVSGEGVTITPATGNPVSVTAAGLDNGGNTINGVGNGLVAPGSQQAVNGGQLFNAQQADRNWAKEYTDNAVAGLNDRIARVGAEGAAEANLGANYRDTPNSIAAGLGWEGGHNGLAVGYRHQSEDGRMSWTIQAAISGPERSVGVGFGYGW
jgi:hypothetical protein